jgi:hypothetical protein
MLAYLLEIARSAIEVTYNRSQLIVLTSILISRPGK